MQKTESVILKIGQLKLSSLRSRKKKELRNMNRACGTSSKIYILIITENFPSLRKDMTLHIQDVQRIPTKINSKIHTKIHYN